MSKLDSALHITSKVSKFVDLARWDISAPQNPNISSIRSKKNKTIGLWENIR